MAKEENTSSFHPPPQAQPDINDPDLNSTIIYVRRSTRDKVPPKLYVPPPPTRRRRPPKPRLSLRDVETVSVNNFSSTPSTLMPQEPMPQIAEKQSNLRKHKQVAESSGVKISPSVCHQEGKKTNSKRKRDNIYVDKNPANETRGSISQILPNLANTLNQSNIESKSSEEDVNLTDILKALNKKHGDITQNSLLESDYIKTLVSLGICRVVQGLQNKRLKDVDTNLLDSCYAAIKDAENMKLDVSWLHKRLDEIKVAIELTDEAKDLEGKRNMCIENIHIKKKELVVRKVEYDRLGSEIRAMEDQLAKEIVMEEELTRKIGVQESFCSRFQQYSSLMDGLI